ncbi:MAG TPA: Xaa-Pro peptidase family protein, partial [Actinomycetota bacterium]|nr:Xaa-Pro peptidase family protein [Actinomycetota bacterium]
MDHAARRGRLARRIDELGIDALLVTRLVNVRYLSGFTGSNAQLLLTQGRGTLFTDRRYEEQAGKEVPDLERVILARGFPDALPEVWGSPGVRRLGFESGGVSYRTWRALSESAASVELIPVGDEVERLRRVKDAEEIAVLQRAQDIADDAFERVTGKLAEGVTERGAAVELEQAMRALGGERVGFDTIVAFGENAAEPHHRPADRALARGDVVKVDFGCVVDGYHSDMTRTVAFGEPDPQLREIHALVLRAHLAGLDAVRAGVTGGAADEAARAVIRQAGFGDRFGHSLGHGVGLEVHEDPSLRHGSDDLLQTGTVVTVEPGVYVPGLGGVRIEDAVVVEEERARPLPRSPKELLI